MRISGICGECGKFYKGERCPKCVPVEQKTGLNFIADFHDSYYDYGLGQVINSRQERKAVMKEKNLVEVGNEKAYVSPEHREKNRDKMMRGILKDAREKAYQYLEKSQWN